MSESWFRIDTAHKRIVLTVHVQPGAKRNEVSGPYGDALKIRIASPPVDGQANAALIAFLAKLFAVPARQVRLLRGQSARYKTVEIAGSARHPASLLIGEDR
jgi:uncharacterized protein